jgi:hypothetical protein
MKVALEKTVVNGLAIRAKRLRAAAVVAFAYLIMVSGCATFPNEPTNPDRVGAVVVVGRGAENGGWRGWAYRTRTGDLCIEVRGTAGGGYNCGQGDNALQGPGIVATDKGIFVIGGTRAAGAASARLDNSDGSQTTASVVAVAPIAPGLRVYILTAPSSAHPQSIEVLDAAGTVIESAAVGN